MWLFFLSHEDKLVATDYIPEQPGNQGLSAANARLQALPLAQLHWLTASMTGNGAGIVEQAMSRRAFCPKRYRAELEGGESAAISRSSCQSPDEETSSTG